jgi:uncharacterized membrane protein
MRMLPLRRRLIVLMVSLAFLAALAAAASSTGNPAPAQNPGSETLQLAGGESGDVDFPHRRHQQSLGDCQVCHSLFPQETGVIEALKSQGALEKKQVMNKLCTRCHKEFKAQGKPSGPTTCKTCHAKAG